jgi:hypothetical protein
LTHRIIDDRHRRGLLPQPWVGILQNYELCHGSYESNIVFLAKNVAKVPPLLNLMPIWQRANKPLANGKNGRYVPVFGGQVGSIPVGQRPSS